MTSAEHHRDTHEVHRPHWAHPVDLGGSQEPRFGGHLLWSVVSDSGQGGRPLWVGCARGPGLVPRPVLRLPSLVTVPPKAHGQPGCEGPLPRRAGCVPASWLSWWTAQSGGSFWRQLKALSGPGTLEALEGSLQWRCLWGPMGVLPALMEPLVGGAPSRQAARQVWPTWAGVNFAREDGHLQKPQSLHRCWAVFARQDELLPVSRGS